MTTSCKVRKNWEDLFPGKSDKEIVGDIKWWAVSHPKGIFTAPYDRTHHSWIAARNALIREARKRGLDISAIAP